MGKFTGIIGIFAILGIAYLLSNNKKNINYKLISWGLSIQLIFITIKAVFLKIKQYTYIHI